MEKEVEVARRLGLPASCTEETELPFRVRAAVRFDNYVATGFKGWENMNVAKEFMADCVSTPGLGSLEGIPLGHGEVIGWRGERVAVYKDERGAASACSAACTHMGCVGHWNSAERSWDCPCHALGSTMTGK